MTAAKFTLSNTKGHLRPSKLLRHTAEATGKRGTIARVTEVEIVLDLEVSTKEDWRAVDQLWPNVDKMAKLVAGEDDRGGMDLTARSKLPDMTIDVFGESPYVEDKQGNKLGDVKDRTALVHLSVCPPRGRAKLRIDEKGEGLLTLKFRGRFKALALGQIVKFLESEVWISMEAAQVDMSEETQLAGADPADAKDAAKPKGASVTPINGSSGSNGVTKPTPKDTPKPKGGGAGASA